MANPSDISTAFIEQWEAELHRKFTEKGGRIRTMTRAGTVRGDKVYWHKLGNLSVVRDRSRHALHTFQQQDHALIAADMIDGEVPSIIDDMDLLKTNIDERGSAIDSAMDAINTDIDSRLLATMIAGAGAEAGGGDAVAFTIDHMSAVAEKFSENHVPDDGRRVCAVSPKTWSRMLKFDEFSNADYIGQGEMPWLGASAKRWRNILWYEETQIAHNAGTNVSSNVAWHPMCVGYGVVRPPATSITFENLISAHIAVTRFSDGSAVIDNEGVFKFSVDVAA